MIIDHNNRVLYFASVEAGAGANKGPAAEAVRHAPPELQVVQGAGKTYSDESA